MTVPVEWLAWAVFVGIVLGTVIPEAMDYARDLRKGRLG